MIRIAVHSPRGGVGKTTIATNLAIFLARRGSRVWALDLAQGEYMTKFLQMNKEFAHTSANKVETHELQTLPARLAGASHFDYLVADTDDFYKIYATLLDPGRKAWRIVAPIVPNDMTGLVRIPDETSQVMKGAILLADNQRPSIRIVMNRCPTRDFTRCYHAVEAALNKYGVQQLLTKAWIPESEERFHPCFVNDPSFADAIGQVLAEIGAMNDPASKRN